MNNENIRLNKYIVHLILGTFLIVITGIFSENITYFRNTLVVTFAEPNKMESVDVNTDKLMEISKDINIDREKISIINK